MAPGQAGEIFWVHLLPPGDLHPAVRPLGGLRLNAANASAVRRRYLFPVTVTMNQADESGLTGIAVPVDGPNVSIVDGGGNRAQGNGTAQWVNLSCAP
jgi:hypothetical protein